MKILVLCSMDIEKKGADKTHLMEICKNLYKLGNELLLVAPGYSPLKQVKEEFPIYYIKIGKKSYLSYLNYHLKLQILIKKLLDNFRPDIIYSRDVLNSFLLYRFARRRNIPFIIEKNSIVYGEFKNRGLNIILIRIGDFLEKMSCYYCDGIIAVTKSIKEEIIKRHKIKEEKIIVIPNGANHEIFIPMDKITIRDKLALDKSFFIVGFTGSFAPWQSLDLLVEAARIIKDKYKQYDIRYLLVGDGEMKKKILDLIKAYNLTSDFVLPGRVNYEDVPKYINALDVAIVIIKSELRGIKYFSPLKFFEYAFCGVPMIFSNNIIGEELDNLKDKLGYKLERNNPNDLAELILNAYKNINLLKKNLCEIRSYLIQNYSWMRIAQKVEGFLKSKIS